MVMADAKLLKAFQRVFRESLTERRVFVEENEPDEEERLDPTVWFGFFENLRQLGWMQPHALLHATLEETLHHTILRWVRDIVSTRFDEAGLIDEAQTTMKEIVLPWLKDLLGEEQFLAEDWTRKIDFACNECYCLVRNEEIENFIVSAADAIQLVKNGEIRDAKTILGILMLRDSDALKKTHEE